MKVIKKIDLFSSPFEFFVENANKRKSTYSGSIISLIIMIVSLGYFTYLLRLYFDNRFLPKITSFMYNQQGLISYVFKDSPFAFLPTLGSESLYDIEQSTGKQYLMYQISYEQYQSGESLFLDIEYEKCLGDPNIADYLCLKFKDQPDTAKKLYSNPQTLEQSCYNFNISPCSGLPNCASPEDIYNMVINEEFYFLIKMRITQFNNQIRDFEEGFSLDNIKFDDNFAVISEYNLQLSEFTLTTGLLFQRQETLNQIGSYRKNQYYNSMNNIQQKAGFQGYASISFCLDQKYNVTGIQYPMITEILAQSMSIFHVLLLVGILARQFSQSKIVEDVNTVFLKEHYKNTALKLIANSNKVKDMKSNKTEQIKQFQSRVDSLRVNLKPKPFYSLNFCQFLKQYLFGVCRNKKNISKEESIYIKMISQTKKKLNICTFYKELINLKLAIKLMLNKDQYAALQYCGCDLNSKQYEDLEQIKPQKKEDETNNKKSIAMLSKDQIDKQSFSLMNNTDGKILQEEKIIEPVDTSLKYQIEMVSNEEQKKSIDKKESTTYLKSNQVFCLENDQSRVDQSVIEKFVRLLPNSKVILKSKTKQEELPCNPNHLQEIEDLESSQNLLYEGLCEFVARFNQNEQISQIDKNIYSSLIGCQSTGDPNNIQ